MNKNETEENLSTRRQFLGRTIGGTAAGLAVTSKLTMASSRAKGANERIGRLRLRLRVKRSLPLSNQFPETRRFQRRTPSTGTLPPVAEAVPTGCGFRRCRTCER